MQGLNRAHASNHVIARTSCWPILALSLTLSACQPRQTDAAIPAPPVAAVAPNPLGKTPSTTELSTSRGVPTPAEKYASPSTTESTNNARILIEEDDVHRPDNSYNQANLRMQYKSCAAASGGVTPAIQACMDEEFRWQQARMRSAPSAQVPTENSRTNWPTSRMATCVIPIATATLTLPPRARVTCVTPCPAASTATPTVRMLWRN